MSVLTKFSPNFKAFSRLEERFYSAVLSDQLLMNVLDLMVWPRRIYWI